VKEALNLTEVKRTQRSINNAHKSKFNHTMKLTALIKSAVEWFESEEGKDTLREEGIEWNKEEFGKKVFGYQKSFFYKLVKVGNLDTRIVEAFNTKCDEIGADANRSIAGLLEFSRDIDLDNLEVSEDATEEEITEAENEAIESASIDQERTNYLFVMTFKNPEGNNLSVRIDDQGNVSGNNLEEIANAIQFLQNSINQ
jgi:hypothetical protein